MNIFLRISVAIIGVTGMIIQQSLAVGVDQDVRAIAKEITVRIDGVDKNNSGSGFIVKRNGNNYTVLTNWHVVERQTIYKIMTTKDNQMHDVNPNSIKRVSPTLDLAELQFTSTAVYKEADLGDSNEVKEDSSIYISGWLNPVGGILQFTYQVLTGTISSIKTEKEVGRSALVYQVSGNYIGMSGGSVLNQSGEVIAINSNAATGPDGMIGLSLGIPINLYQKPSPKHRTLEELLKAGRLKEANDKTWEMLLEKGDLDNSNDLDSEETRQLDCKTLRQIDESWDKYSNGKFGFKKQRQIYEEINNQSFGGMTNLPSYNSFGEKVGWRKSGQWLLFSQLVWSKAAPAGYFPVWFIYRQNQIKNLYGLPDDLDPYRDPSALFFSPGTSLIFRLKTVCLI